MMHAGFCYLVYSRFQYFSKAIIFVTMDKMKKIFFTCLFILLSVLPGTRAGAQSALYGMPTYAFHISSPLGFFYKAGAKFEYRLFPENALLLSYTKYWGYFPGYQGYLEYRIYFNTKTVAENLIYTKLGTGFADYESSALFSNGKDLNKGPGTYYFGGAGVGKHFNYRIFFLEISAGLKFTHVAKPPSQYNERLFYSIGPGSIPEVHLNFGLQF